VQKTQQGSPGPGRPRGQHGSNPEHEQRRILNRGSEPERAYFRCGRYFTVGHEWYAMTREGESIGPCATRHLAEIALASHLTDRGFDIFGQIGQFERDPTVLEVLAQELAYCQQHSRLRTENSAYVWAQQRLAKFEKNPAEHDHADIRAGALRHFLSGLDS